MNHLFHLETPTAPMRSSYPIGLVVTTYNRPVYLQRFLRALARSQLTDVVLILVDDGSTDPTTQALLQNFTIANTPILKAYRRQKQGCAMYENLRYGWDLLHERFQCQYLCNVDPDTHMQKNWLQTIRALYEQEAQGDDALLVTGFNAYQHPVLVESTNYYHKQSIGGLNLFFDRDLYETLVRPALAALDWDWRVVRAMQEQGHRILCTRPSVIQHIGREGVWSGKSSVYDFAIDYGSVHPFYTTLSRLYFRGRRRVEWLLTDWQTKVGRAEIGQKR